MPCCLRVWAWHPLYLLRGLHLTSSLLLSLVSTSIYVLVPLFSSSSRVAVTSTGVHGPTPPGGSMPKPNHVTVQMLLMSTLLSLLLYFVLRCSQSALVACLYIRSVK